MERRRRTPPGSWRGPGWAWLDPRTLHLHIAIGPPSRLLGRSKRAARTEHVLAIEVFERASSVFLSVRRLVRITYAANGSDVRCPVHDAEVAVPASPATHTGTPSQSEGGAVNISGKRGCANGSMWHISVSRQRSVPGFAACANTATQRPIVHVVLMYINRPTQDLGLRLRLRKGGAVLRSGGVQRRPYQVERWISLRNQRRATSPALYLASCHRQTRLRWPRQSSRFVATSNGSWALKDRHLSSTSLRAFGAHLWRFG